jgi:hypothetical protein
MDTLPDNKTDNFQLFVLLSSNDNAETDVKSLETIMDGIDKQVSQTII